MQLPWRWPANYSGSNIHQIGRTNLKICQRRSLVAPRIAANLRHSRKTCRNRGWEKDHNAVCTAQDDTRSRRKTCEQTKIFVISVYDRPECLRRPDRQDMDPCRRRLRRTSTSLNVLHGFLFAGIFARAAFGRHEEAWNCRYPW